MHLAKANLLVLGSIPRAVLFGAELGFQICRKSVNGIKRD